MRPCQTNQELLSVTRFAHIAFMAAFLALCGCGGGQAKAGAGKNAPPAVSGTSPRKVSAERYGVEVVKEYPHSTKAYTQGLFFHGGTLYESTGQYGESGAFRLDAQSGKSEKFISLDSKYFGEGSTIFEGRLYMLTWTSRVAFAFDPSDGSRIKTYTYPRDGWGLTTDGRWLIASDGSANLYFLDAELNLKRTVKVTMNGKPLRFLNELEYIDGKIFANIYTTDFIAIIAPGDGIVEGIVDCTGLLPEKLRAADTDVLNGIAAVPGTDRLLLTGKNWPRMYEVRLVKK